MSMVDTWAATGAGAYSLSENGLYTVEGWRTFFRHLTPTGVFTVSRWYSPNNIDETGRMMSVAVAALLEEGVSNPRDHLFLASVNNLATLIVSRAPFPATELARLTARVDELGFKVVAEPRSNAESQVLTEILKARTPDNLFHLTSKYHLDLSPASDDRPFFFQQIRLSDPLSYMYAMKSDNGVVRGNLRAMSTLAGIIAISMVLVLEIILIPSLPSVRRAALGLTVYGSAYFLLIGLGFMFVEIGLIQRISVYLGHPVYGLSIGLFGIIISSGVGSLMSARISLLRGNRILDLGNSSWHLSFSAALLGSASYECLCCIFFARARIDFPFGHRAFGRAHGFWISHRNADRPSHGHPSHTLVLGCEWSSRGVGLGSRRHYQHRLLDQYNAVVRSGMLFPSWAGCGFAVQAWGRPLLGLDRCCGASRGSVGKSDKAIITDKEALLITKGDR